MQAGKNKKVLGTEDLNEKSSYLTDTDKLYPIVGHGSEAPEVLKGLYPKQKETCQVPKDTSVIFWCPQETSLDHWFIRELAEKGPVFMYKYYKSRGLKMEVYQEGDWLPNYITTGPRKGEDWSDIDKVSKNDHWDIIPRNILKGQIATMQYYLSQMAGSNIHWLACRDVNLKSTASAFLNWEPYGALKWLETLSKYDSSDFDIFESIEKKNFKGTFDAFQNSKNYDDVEKLALKVLVGEEPFEEEKMEEQPLEYPYNLDKWNVDEWYAHYDNYRHYGSKPSFPDLKWYDYGPYETQSPLKRKEMIAEVLKIVWHAYDMIDSTLAKMEDKGEDRYQRVSSLVQENEGLKDWVLSMVSAMVTPRDPWKSFEKTTGNSIEESLKQKKEVQGNVASLWGEYQQRERGDIEKYKTELIKVSMNKISQSYENSFKSNDKQKDKSNDKQKEAYVRYNKQSQWGGW